MRSKKEIVAEATEWTGGVYRMPPLQFTVYPSQKLQGTSSYLPGPIDFSTIVGQWEAKRGIEIGAAGGHPILFIGPQEQVSSRLAQATLSVLPQTALPYPFAHVYGERGGAIVAAAHVQGGVLYLEGFQYLPQEDVEYVRQACVGDPTHEGQDEAAFPRFLCLASALPCHCGWYGNLFEQCTCPSSVATEYRQQLRERVSSLFPLRLTVSAEQSPAVQPEGSAYAELATSSQVRQRVESARTWQQRRYAHDPALWVNDDLQQGEVEQYCSLEEDAERFFALVCQQYHLSPPKQFGCLKVARTIADLAASPAICANHLAEALALCSQV